MQKLKDVLSTEEPASVPKHNNVLIPNPNTTVAASVLLSLLIQ